MAARCFGRKISSNTNLSQISFRIFTSLSTNRTASYHTQTFIDVGQPSPSSHPELMREGEITPGISSQECQKRRNELISKLPEGSAAVKTMKGGITVISTQSGQEKGIPFISAQSGKEKGIPFIAEYLISSLGFSPDRALKLSASDHLSPIKTPNRPDSIIRFLRKTGLSDAQIRSLVSFQPIILSSSVDKILEPRARELIAAGFAGETLVQLIRLNPLALNCKNTLPKLLYWRKFVGNSDEVLLKIIQRNGLLITRNVDTHWLPKLELLKEYGLSQQDIIKILLRGCRFMFQNLDSLKKILERTEELGFPRGSGMFCAALRIVGSFKKESWDKKVRFYMKTFGLSEEEVSCVFKKFPTLFGLSDEKLKSKMDFLVKEADIVPNSIVSQPIILARSLEKNLVPRNCVLSMLRERKLSRNYSLFHACGMSEERFVEKFVEPYEDIIPELAKAYRSAYGGENL